MSDEGNMGCRILLLAKKAKNGGGLLLFAAFYAARIGPPGGPTICCIRAGLDGKLLASFRPRTQGLTTLQETSFDRTGTFDSFRGLRPSGRTGARCRGRWRERHPCGYYGWAFRPQSHDWAAGGEVAAQGDRPASRLSSDDRESG